MAQPKLIIGGVDFTELVASIAPSNNDLDADGSGRDISDGEMHRTKIADKDKLEVTMMRLWEGDMITLQAALRPAFVSVQYLNPRSNLIETKTMYCSALKHGLQIYNRSKRKTFYEGAQFDLTEK